MLIALSGGADSVALFLMMLERGEAEAAAHCNFHLRGAESDRDEDFVRTLCQKHGVRLFVQHFDTAAEAAHTGDSIEMAARRLRYTWFAELCREHGFRHVAVAHHQEDNAETVLMNLVRGTGLRGLCGMSAEHDGVVRPLLKLSKAQIIAYLKEKGQTYVTDSTNADTHYRRNFVRHRVLPLLQEINPQAVQSINRTAARLTEVELIYRIGLQHLRAAMTQNLSDGFCINAEALAQSGVATTLLHEWLSPLGFSAEQLTDIAQMHTGALVCAERCAATRTAHTIEVRSLPQRQNTLALPANDGCIMLADGRRIHIYYITRARMSEIPREPFVVALDAARLSGKLFVRSAESGDKFSPFGMRGRQLVSDFLTNRHRSRIDKMKSLVLCDAEGIVWLVGERIDNRAAVSNATSQVVLLKLSDK